MVVHVLMDDKSGHCFHQFMGECNFIHSMFQTHVHVNEDH